MARILRLTLLALLGFAPLAARSETSGGNLVSVLNSFIAVVAKDHPEFKKDIKLVCASDPVPAGYQIGKSAALDTYIFRPKTWQELTPAEKQSVISHPRLKAFLVSLRNARTYPSVSAGASAPEQLGSFPVEGASDRPTEYRVRIDPEEMIRNRPVVIPVVPVEQGSKN